MTLYELQMSLRPTIKARFENKVKSQGTGYDDYGIEVTNCFYRKDGDRNNLDPSNCCGIGSCIAPNNYKSSFETKNAGFITSEAFPESKSLTQNEQSKFKMWLNLIQEIHDDSEIQDWDHLLKDFTPKEI